ncbi:succinate dehydrogenase iron-sulfur subunit [candidate division KSB1 bacterium]|jgi:succinate dehydrogenase / fumarate reductase iron-sulfur subunit|nr:succinate dehydrogenase iron-sulfur subunit [candidate division KSB1 bacterium]
MSEQSNDKTTTIIFEVLRYNPETDNKPSVQEYKVQVTKGMTVLDGLTWIKEHLDSTLAWRSSCRMGVCGSCAMFINGLPRLACNNQILHLTDKRIVVKPLPNFDIVRDLVPDLDGFFEKHGNVKPWLIRKEIKEQNNPTAEYFQSPEELVNYIQFAYCIKCGACLSACPTVATDDRFLGPQALAQAWRYMADSRDEGDSEREDPVYSQKGAYRCHFAGACSEACPKGVDPAFAIQLLKKHRFCKTLGKCQETEGTTVAEPITEFKENPKIAKPPEPTL